MVALAPVPIIIYIWGAKIYIAPMSLEYKGDRKTIM